MKYNGNDTDNIYLIYLLYLIRYSAIDINKILQESNHHASHDAYISGDSLVIVLFPGPINHRW